MQSGYQCTYFYKNRMENIADILVANDMITYFTYLAITTCYRSWPQLICGTIRHELLQLGANFGYPAFLDSHICLILSLNFSDILTATDTTTYFKIIPIGIFIKLLHFFGRLINNFILIIIISDFNFECL